MKNAAEAASFQWPGYCAVAPERSLTETRE